MRVIGVACVIYGTSMANTRKRAEVAILSSLVQPHTHWVGSPDSVREGTRPLVCNGSGLGSS